MNKSLDYIRQCILNPGTRISDRDIDRAIVVPLTRYLQIRENEPVDAHYSFSNSEYKCECTAHLIYNPNADFEYFTSSESTHDGTLLFVDMTVNDCLNNILQLKTYNVKKGFPKNLNDAEFTFTIGDVVIINEYDPKFAPADKPWMQERTTVLIPLIYDFREKET